MNSPTRRHPDTPDRPPRDCSLVVAVLRDPTLVSHLAPRDWNSLLPQARQSNLMARLETAIEEAGALARVPTAVRNHLESARRLSERHREAVLWEIHRVQEALEPLGVPIALLKGAAYVAAGLPVARGRVFSDVDIMVPKEAIDRVEKALQRQGWVGVHSDPYDQKYYRTWMHEIPPLQHRLRQTVLDVHHTILPPTARLHPDPQKLWQAARPVAADGSELYLLAPTDMVLHSATHLFHDGEFENGLRDLVDLDGLLRHFGSNEPDFWTRLPARAGDMDLSRPLYYALRYTTRLLATPVPADVLRACAPGGPPAWQRLPMDALFLRGLQPNLPRCNDAPTAIARFVLYLRSHWLRMPLHLLVPHLVRKSLRRAPQD